MNHQFILFRGRAITFLLLCIALSASVRAQELNYLFGVDLGGNILGNDYTIHLYDYLVRPIGSVYGEYYLTNSLALHASLGAGMFAWDVDRSKIRTGFGYGQVGAMFRLYDNFDYPIPAVFARAGILSKKVLTNQGGFPVEEDLLLKFMYSLGVILDYRITERLALRLNFAANLTNIDDLDGTIAGQKYDGFTSATVGLSWLVFRSEPGIKPELSELTPVSIDTTASQDEESAGNIMDHGDPRSVEVLGHPLGINMSNARSDTDRTVQKEITPVESADLARADSAASRPMEPLSNDTSSGLLTMESVDPTAKKHADSAGRTFIEHLADSITHANTNPNNGTTKPSVDFETVKTMPLSPEKAELRYIVDKGDVVDVELPDMDIGRDSMPQDSSNAAAVRKLPPEKALQITRYLEPVFGTNAITVGSILDKATRYSAGQEKREVTIRSWKPLALANTTTDITMPAVSEVTVPEPALDSIRDRVPGAATETNDAHPPRLDPNTPPSTTTTGSGNRKDQPSSEKAGTTMPIQHDAAPIFPRTLNIEEKATLAREKVEEAFQQALAIDSYLKDEKLPEKKIAIVVSEVYFEFDKTDITPEARLVLDNVVRQLQVHPDVTAEIRGYADEIGDEEYNQALSRRRADAVTRYLFERGIQSPRLKAIGFGAIHASSQITPSVQSRHRRVEITLVNRR